jgi:hypothetical protein
VDQIVQADRDDHAGQATPRPLRTRS